MRDSFETIKKIREINKGFPYTEPVKKWKEQERKVVGWGCDYVPEEILYAAGILPFRVTGDSRELPLTSADAYLSIYECSFVRSCLQLALDRQFDFLDGFVACSTCDGMRRLADEWRITVNVPVLYVLSVPRKFTPRAHDFYKREVIKLTKLIEERFGLEVTDHALREAIQVYNESRGLLRNLYDLRKLERPPISGAEMLEVTNAASRMPRGQYNQILKALLAEAAMSDRSWEGTRLMIGGSILSNSDFIQGIENMGGVVVADALCCGTRYWGDLVRVDAGGDPLAAIAERYLNNFPCPRMFPTDERINRILSLASEFQVDGVIWQTIRYCNPMYYEQPRLKDRLEQRGIPILLLDIEYGMTATGQVKTRAQAFIEMLQETRGRK